MSNYVESDVLIVTFHKYLEYLVCLEERFENAWNLTTFIATTFICIYSNVTQSIPALNVIFTEWNMMFTVGYIMDIF